MAVLLITYSLKTPNKDYSSLFEAIKATAAFWWHYIDDTWIVETNLSAEEFAHKLYPHFTRLDYLLVVKITREHQGWLPKDAWDWLNDRNY